jgi:alpha-tubulin suppressor-like RCC1 family protein
MSRTGFFSSAALQVVLGLMFCPPAALSDIMAWDYHPAALTNVPPNLSNVVSISGGGGHVLALKADGSVIAWGANASGQTNVPPSATNVIAISAGFSHNLVLRSNGTIVAWGLNNAGQTNVPIGLTNVVGIAAGKYHSLALLANGSVVVWGTNSSRPATVPPEATNAVAIAAGSVQSLALTADGKVVSWGNFAATNVPAVLTNVVAIAAGGSFSLALTADGFVKAWPADFQSPFLPMSVTNIPSGLSNVVAIAAASSHALALRSDGKIISWGTYGGSPPFSPGFPATNVPSSLSNVVAVSASDEFSLALVGTGPPVITAILSDHTVAYGSTAYLRVEAGGAFPLQFQWRYSGEDLPGATNALLVLTNMQLEQSGAYSVVVSNALGMATNSETQVQVLPIALTSQPKSLVSVKGTSAAFSVEVASPSAVNYQWHFGDADLPGETYNTLVLTNVQYAQAGEYSVTVSNEFGALQSTHATLKVTPIAIWGSTPASLANPPPDLTNVVAITAGISFELALKADGRVAAWGVNTVGSTDVPSNATNVIAVSANYYSCLALKSNGSVIAWGNNAHGQRDVPVGLSNVVAIAAGYQHSLALKSDGRVVGWGMDTAVTNQPALLENVVAISAGSSFSLALRGDGTVVAWGDNNSGTNLPPGLQDVVAVAAGGAHGLALLANGTVAGWGSDSSGQSAAPADLTNVVAIAAGSGQSLALKVDGTIVAWGSNASGQTNIPADVGNVAAIAGGYSHSSALVAEGPPFLMTPLVNRTVVFGSKVSFFAAASGAGPITYLWRLDGTNIAGATNAILTIEEVHFSDSARYSVVASNSLGSVTSPEASLNVVPLRIATQPKGKSTFRGDDVSLVVIVEGQEPLTYQWRRDDADLADQTNSMLNLLDAQPGQSGDYSVVVSNLVGVITSSVVVVSIGDVAVWGDSYFNSYDGPMAVPPGATNIIAVSAGARHTLALRKDGTVIAWGGNTYGEAEIPQGLSNVIAIAAGYRHNLALLADGTVVAWPTNIYSTPPNGLSNVVAIAAGSDLSAALKTDGTVISWGYGNVGQTNPPSNLTNVVALASRYDFSLALTMDGRVVGWGWDNYGQTDAPTLTDFVAIGAGTFHSAAVRANGTVLVWGDTRIVDTPANLGDAISVSCGDNHAMALKRDGTVFVWGNMTNVPSRLHSVVAISAGFYHNVALIGDGPPTLTATLFEPRWTSNTFRVTFPSRSGKVYSLEYSESAQPSFFTSLPLAAGNGEPLEMSDSTATNSPQRFYRVRRW